MLKENGYNVAAVATNIRNKVKADSDLEMTVDICDHGCLKGAFRKVEKELDFPNVVVYNRELRSAVFIDQSSFGEG